MNDVENIVELDWVSSQDKLLKQFKGIEFKDIKDPTFLDIINKGRNENTWSRVLLFFFDPNKEHNLKDLFLKSLFQLLDVNFALKNPKSFYGRVEKSTEDGKRIDIFIQTDEFVIGIENKVYHDCNNPFHLYDEMLKDLAGTKKLHKVILSLNHCSEVSGFKNIRYEQFVSKIEANLPEYENHANPLYLMFLKDFLRNIKNVQKSMHMLENEKAIKFFKDYSETLTILTDRFGEFKQFVENRFRELYSAINLDGINSNVKLLVGNQAEITKDNSDDGLDFYITMTNGEMEFRREFYIEKNLEFFSCFTDNPPKEFLDRLEDLDIWKQPEDDINTMAKEIVEQIESEFKILFGH
ncbi:PD-(D/E)XK nuclease family protein [Sunxiuqinia sp. sy24]|uniref:PD-(D/E)XK nuclease family protein n=1 Tax=Sunxiuqinia sp. sy24 TaxID=3461495 RepID=UPI004045F14B